MPRQPQGRRQHLKLYLAGQRVPLRSFSLSASIGQSLSASIEIPPTPLVTQILPRTLVHVVGKESGEQAYRLIFEGEYVGHALSESRGGKGFSMQCAGLTNYWDTVYQHFINRLSPAAIGDIEKAAFSSGTTADPAVSSVNIQLPAEVAGSPIVQALLRADRDFPRALLSVVSLMANVRTKNGDLESPRINQQIERAFVNMRLGERVFVLPDEQLKSLIDAKVGTELLFRHLHGQLSDFSTLAEVVQRFLSFAYYEWVAIPNPSYTPRATGISSVTAGTGLDFFTPADIGGGEDTPQRTTISSVVRDSGRGHDTENVQRDVVFKPRSYFLPPPTCNLVFPCQYEGFTSQRMFLQEPTRLRIRAHATFQGGEDHQFYTVAYYAPKEVKEGLTVEALGGTSTQDEASLADVIVPFAPAAPAVSGPKTFRQQILVSAPERGIDESVTGVIPAFEEMGPAEYAALESRLAEAAGQPDAEASVSDALFGPPTREEAESVVEQENLRNEVDSGRLLAGAAATLYEHQVQIADYRLDLRRANMRSAQGVSGPYNENLALGFPGLVFSKTAILAGEIVNLNVTASAGGMATTVFTLGYVRYLSLLPAIAVGSPAELALLELALTELAVAEVDSGGVPPSAAQLRSTVIRLADAKKLTLSKDRLNLLLDGFDPADHSPVRPRWVNASYSPERIATDVYQPLFGPGVGSSVSVFAGGRSTNQVLAANVLFLRYLQAPDRLAFVDKLTARPVATAEQVLTKFLGLGVKPSEAIPERTGAPPAEDLTVKLGLGTPENLKLSRYSPFLKSQVDAVKRYNRLLRTGRGLRG